MPAVVPGLPPAELAAAPSTIEQMASLLAAASAAKARALIWGGGQHQGFGGRIQPDLVISTSGLDRVIAWEPEDLTLVVEAGARAATVEDLLSQRRQTAVLSEIPGEASVGGLISANLSGYRRARHGPIRDRVLEVTLVTGDGRVVRGGARVVKNVTGYDLPRLATGAFGAVGVVVAVCLKLWPRPVAAATVWVEDPETAARVYRPLAILSDSGSHRIYLAGTDAEVDAQVSRLKGRAEVGHHWPVSPGGELGWVIRVPPARLEEAIGLLPPDWSFVAQRGVGVIEVGAPSVGPAPELREWAESTGGAMVLARAPDQVYDQIDPWGTPPTTLDLQKKLVGAFDPSRVINPGRLPGGL
jgi:glycolate oxidase FAD binding subunit